MKKSVLVFGLMFLVLTLGINLVFALNATELRQVNEAYSCLNEVIEDERCSSLGERDQIFAYLATGKCLDEVMYSSKSGGECWPEDRCSIKMTAQAVFALDKRGKDTSKAKEWLLEQTMVPSNLDWFLQIESGEETSCDVYYDDGDEHTSVQLNEDKTISITENTGSCLSLGPGGYWLRINNVDDCQYMEYETTCYESGFFTNLLFKENDAPTIHVVDDTNPRESGGTTLEKIDSFCFSTGSTCDYEDNAWATMVLDIAGEEMSSFVPYLITSAEREYFPDPFLYSLTGIPQYKTNIMNQQINGEYWRAVENKYYDTALALLPFAGETFDEKSSAIEWLLSVQEEDGCWEGGNVRDNSFLLYSLWPRASSAPIIPDEDDCKDFNYFCEASGNCEDGNVLSEYECFGSQVCCKEEHVEKTCFELQGKICFSGEYCDGEETYTNGNDCCLANCKEYPEEEMSQCEQNNGDCEVFECEEGYEDISFEHSCNDPLDYCCVPEANPGITSYWWIWVLFVLIILIIVAIIYREKLKEAFSKMGHKGPPAPNTGNFPRRPGMPPTYNRMPQRRPPIQRKIVPQPQRRPMNPPVQKPRPPKELDDVLKKLKEMSN